METRINQAPLKEIETEALVVLVWEHEAGQPVETAPEVREFAGSWLDEILESAECTGKLFEISILHHPAAGRAKRLVALGCGKRRKFGVTELRKIAGAALRKLKSRNFKRIALALPDGCNSAEFVAAAIEGAILGDFEADRYKTEKNDNKKVVELFAVAAPVDDAPLESGRAIAEAQNFTRSLANEPANRLTPTVLADHAIRLAATYGLECEVLDRDRMQQLGMGALLGVAQGSSEPPALILLRYKPENPASAAHLGLVGKGVTFDTGGISIKPSEGMEKMRYDMSGGAAVLGAMRALAQLKPPIAVTGVIPAVENMPGSRAQRPGDIVTSLSGKTIEVLNTDAEGRLILADAITYAKRLGCTHLVDVATLTGSIVIALGHLNVGLFSNDEQLGARVLAASRAEGEKMWQMPLEDEYKDYLKSAFADLPNVGGRWGGSITAAMFLKEFADETPWVHLDIAGTAWLDDKKAWMGRGPTGIPVRTFCRLALDWKD